MTLTDIKTNRVYRVSDNGFRNGKNLIYVSISDNTFNPFTRMFWVKYFHFTSLLKDRIYELESKESKYKKFVKLDHIKCERNSIKPYNHTFIFEEMDNFQVFKHYGKKK